MSGIAEYQEKVAEPLKDIDIGILVANAGAGIIGRFNDLTGMEV